MLFLCRAWIGRADFTIPGVSKNCSMRSSARGISKKERRLGRPHFSGDSLALGGSELEKGVNGELQNPQELAPNMNLAVYNKSSKSAKGE